MASQLLLPEDYRVHGPDLVALSFFAVSFDHGAGTILDEAMRALFDDPGDKPPDDPRLLPFWRAIKVPRHPHLHRTEDVLGDSYAVIWLTQREFEGPLCAPPHLPDNPEIDRPDWLEVGTATNFWRRQYSPSPDLRPEEYLIYKLLGQLPEHDLAFNRALTWTPRVHDGNAGKAAREQDASEYKDVFKLDHIGGTMRLVQATPELSPFYIEFEEYLGGYNFGGGNAQLDLQQMQFDWACG
jgi:hypothetical protein